MSPASSALKKRTTSSSLIAASLTQGVPQNSDDLLVTPVAADRHREQDRQVHPGVPVLADPPSAPRGVAVGDEPVSYLLRYPPEGALAIASQQHLTHPAQARTPV